LAFPCALSGLLAMPLRGESVSFVLVCWSSFRQ
jgi:hypothetical protein